MTFNAQRSRGRWHLRAGGGALEGVGRSRHGAGRGLGRGHRRRPAAGDLVAGVERVGRGPQPAAGRAGRAADGARGPHAVHAHAAGDRHARADGRGARLARQADRLGRHPRAGHAPRGLGRQGPPRVGAVPPGQDQPQLLHLRPLRPDRPDLRRHRQDHRPHAGGPAATPTCSSSAPTSSPRWCTTATSR